MLRRSNHDISLTVIPQQKRNPRTPCRILRVGIPSALPRLEIQRRPAASTCSLTREPHARETGRDRKRKRGRRRKHALRLVFPKSNPANKERSCNKDHARVKHYFNAMILRRVVYNFVNTLSFFPPARNSSHSLSFFKSDSISLSLSFDVIPDNSIDIIFPNPLFSFSP